MSIALRLLYCPREHTNNEEADRYTEYPMDGDGSVAWVCVCDECQEMFVREYGVILE